MTTRPANITFHWYPYATFSESVVLKDADAAPIDLTGYTALMHVRRDRDDATTLYVLSTESGEITLGGTDGSMVLTIPATETDDVPLLDPDGEAWAYDLLLTNTNTTPATVERVYQGYIVVHPGVTRPE